MTKSQQCIKDCEWVAGQDLEFLTDMRTAGSSDETWSVPQEGSAQGRGCLFKMVNTEHSVCMMTLFFKISQ